MMKNKINVIVFAVFLSSVMILTGCSSNSNLDVNNQKQNTMKVSQTDNVSQKKDNASDNVTQQITKSQNTKLNDNKQLLNASIIKNIDGDTIDINLEGKEEKVRMLCVDTPETHHPRLGVQPFGPEASDFTKKTLYVGRKVQVELGIGGGRDKYGRLLAYIYVDGKMFNEMLLEKGLARVAYIYAPNTKYVDEFYAIQKQAQQKGIGIWSIENYAKEDGYHVDAAKGSKNSSSLNSSRISYQNNQKDDQESNLNCKGKIKGNVNSHIYHVPSGAFYDSTKDNIIWFCSEQDAEKAGYRKSKR
jgi:micrococcal nuclease